MSGNLEENDDEITGINVTPLVDVMLVLLVIFMVTTTYIVNRSILVKLPKAETGGKHITSKNLAFVLDKDSNLFIDGKKMLYTEIENYIKNVKISNKENLDLQALISADEKTKHGEVVRLIDYIRKAGVLSFALNVEAITQ